jgi:hypothetical protein
MYQTVTNTPKPLSAVTAAVAKGEAHEISWRYANMFWQRQQFPAGKAGEKHSAFVAKKWSPTIMLMLRLVGG